LEGSFACAILIKDHDELYFMKRSSPILIGVGEGANYLASDAVPMVHYTSKFVDVDDDDYGYMTPSEYHLYKDGKESKPISSNAKSRNAITISAAIRTSCSRRPKRPLR
jgi:glucosamine 6-phosphate synthetase-like amidotransferase/phosphosugar isomerase protein